MGVDSGRALVAELAFQVFDRALHPDWFRTKVHQRVARERWQADLRIIEGGHAVVFGCGPIRLTETLSGPETDLPDPGRLFHSVVRRERSTTLRPGSSIEYQTCFEVERLEPEVFRHLCEELISDGSREVLRHRFGPGNRMLPSPISCVHIDARNRGLSVQTFHTFPAECAIVRTQSLYEVAEPNARDDRRR